MNSPVKFEAGPVKRGPLHPFSKIRAGILSDVVQRSEQDFESAIDKPGDLELILEEALYQERQRLARRKPIWHHSSWFTWPRDRRDRELWGSIARGLKAPIGTPIPGSDRVEMLSKILGHYSEEIGAHFDPRVYWAATRVLPWGFNYLLNAASFHKILPWKMTQALESRLRIRGQVEQLRNLSKKGTVLLVPTHQSNLDSLLVGYVIYLMGLPPFSYGAGLNLFSNPVLSFFMRNLGSYTVDRGKSNAMYKSVLKNYSSEILKRGVHSIFFPGGGRSRSGAIEAHPKLGLLGTGLQAQIQNLMQGKPNANIYIVPMVSSYHFVIEAQSLVEEYLGSVGRHRFMPVEPEFPLLPIKLGKFLWKFFQNKSVLTVRVGQAMDVFGNLVDAEGHSLSRSGSRIDIKALLTSQGELRQDPQRDREYTAQLGRRLVRSFHRENTVLASALACWVYFDLLRRHYPDLDLFRFLRLSTSQRMVPWGEFMNGAESMFIRLRAMQERGELHLCEDFLQYPLEKALMEGIRQLGLLHDAEVIKVRDGMIWTEDMNLLYYYRNRLTGYGLSDTLGETDAKGFLA